MKNTAHSANINKLLILNYHKINHNNNNTYRNNNHIINNATLSSSSRASQSSASLVAPPKSTKKTSATTQTPPLKLKQTASLPGTLLPSTASAIAAAAATKKPTVTSKKPNLIKHINSGNKKRSAAPTTTKTTTKAKATATKSKRTDKFVSRKMGGGKVERRCLKPLEFEECIVDSPEFRANLNSHEYELDHTSHQIKKIIKEVKELMSATKVLSTRMKQLAVLLNEFNFECIGTAQTDDEMVICESLKHFSNIIGTIEDEREKMLTLADKHIIEPLENFRKNQIGGVKENKKKFDKKTEKFCQSQERFLNMSTKKPENTILEADASLGMHEREYVQESLSYVLRIQEVQERIKFEFVEILLAFISSWLLFYHTAHESAEDNRHYLQDLRHKVQKTRENFANTREKVNELKTKYMEKRTKPEEKYTKRGYLFLMEKSSLLKVISLEPFKATWTKYYCTYKKQKKEFTMLQFNQMSHSSARPEAREEEKLTLLTCQRRASEFEKRFCFDLTFREKPGIVYTFQALSEEDRRGWISAMEGTEPTYLAPGKLKTGDEYQLDETGFAFVRKCIQVLEARGLEDEGIYRKSGVGTKITRLLALGMDRKKAEGVFTDEQYRDLMESNTIASALKTYLRNLHEPLMTYRYHSGFIEAAKQECLNQRVHEVHKLVYKLPQPNFEMLDLVIKHLTEVSRKFEKNKMSVFNLGVVFGPTLLRPMEETVAAILDIKFNNIVINILIENYDRIFKNDPSSGAALMGPVGPPQATTSPPMRVPRSGNKHNTSAGSNGRPSMYSPQQQVFRVVAKSNYTEPAMSSSLQNIPNGMMYGSTGGTTSVNGGHLKANGGAGGDSAGPMSLGGMSGGLNMGSIKNLHSMSQSDISGRRPTANSLEPLYGHSGGGVAGGTSSNGSSNLSSYHASPASTWHDYLMTTTTATPVSTTTPSSSTNHIYGSSTGSSHHTVNNLSPPSIAMRTEALYGSAGGSGGGGGGGGSAVAAVSPPSNSSASRGGHYAHGKHYSPVAAASTSSSNESVCDSLSSTNGGGGGVVGIGRLGPARGPPIDCVPQGSTLSSLLGSTCDDVITTTAAPSMIVGSSGGGSSSSNSPNDAECAPQKMDRNKELNQIKRNLSAGTACVRTLFACMAESEGELSFEPNQIITNVRFSNEPGWLQGMLNGKTGLIPENYVELLKPYH